MVSKKKNYFFIFLIICLSIVTYNAGADSQLHFGYGGDSQISFGLGFDIQTGWWGDFPPLGPLADLVEPRITVVLPLNGSSTVPPILFDITATDAFGVSSCWMSLDDWSSNQTMTNTVGNTWQYTNTTLAVGNWTVLFGCNDTSSNFNSTLSNFTVISAAPDCEITSNSPVTYPTELWVNGSCNGAYNMYKNGTAVTIPYNETTGVGTYTFIVNMSGASASTNVVVNQGTSEIQLLLNGTRGDIIFIKPVESNATLLTGDGNISMYFNGSLINYGVSPLSNITSDLFWDFAPYQFVANYSGNNNWSSAQEVWYVVRPGLNITTPPNGSTITTQPVDFTVTSAQAPVNCSWTINDFTTNNTFTYPTGEIGAGNLTFGTEYQFQTTCWYEFGSETSGVTFYFSSRGPEETWIWIFSIIIFIFVALMIIGYYTEQPFWPFMAGLLFMLAGVYLLINGFPGITDQLLEYGMGVIITGIGMYITVVSSHEFLRKAEED